MGFFKCKMCGGTIEFTEGATVGVCDSCGTKQTLPKVSDDIIANLFARANALRLKCEFDKAEQIYNKILEQDNSEAEAHWGVILCKYGIEYVDDPITGKKIPTCHRTSYDSIIADNDYKAALENASGEQKSLYEIDAKTIDTLQKNILDIVKTEKPFDVFICYKETNENGKRSADSVIANEIYHQLTTEGFKVFYAAITLEEKLGKEYEPYIFAALNSAKVMLCIGSKPEYFNSVWVKNEWSRFLKLMKTDSGKLLIPCYKDMDAYELPEEFAHLQAQDMSKIGFINDIIRGIKKVLATNTSKEQVQTSDKSATTVVDPLLERAFMSLEDGEWDKADNFCEQVLNQDPKNATAYLGKLMAELKVKQKADLDKLSVTFDDKNNCQKAMRFGGKELSDFLKSCNKSIVYNSAQVIKQNAQSEEEYKKAAEMFKTIPGFKDADELSEECRKDSIYAKAKEKTEYEPITNKYATAHLEEAIEVFGTISGFKDTDEQIAECQRKIEEIKAKEEADKLEAERIAEERRIAKEKARKRLKRIIAITTPAVAVCVAFVILLNTVIIPKQKLNKAMKLLDSGDYEKAYSLLEEIGNNDAIASSKYDRAVELIDSGDYEAAYALLEELGNNDAIASNKYDRAVTLIDSGDYEAAYLLLNGLDYKDSAEKATECLFLKQKDGLTNVSVGSTIKFGIYEQDNSTSNGKEEIEWKVLAVESNKALIISQYALDSKPYNNTFSDTTWEKCTLRTWLNGTFYDAAFGADHQKMIASSTVTADKNPSYSTSPGNNTTDKVFLLSITEVNKYFSSDSARQCSATAYAKAQVAYTNTSNGNCCWWLRSPGLSSRSAACVRSDGSVYWNFVYHDSDAVRPALWINLGS